MADMRGLVASLPESLGRPEQMVIGGVLDQLLARFGSSGPTDGRPTMSAWRQRWFRTTECGVASRRSDVDERRYRPLDARVTQMLRLIEMQYVDPTLSLLKVAGTINVCPSHAARLLKQRTGHGFPAHVHRYRIAHARQLLAEASLSIKEIAAAVGYAHPSQLSRHFKIACGETPLAFRSTRIDGRHST